LNQRSGTLYIDLKLESQGLFPLLTGKKEKGESGMYIRQHSSDFGSLDVTRIGATTFLLTQSSAMIDICGFIEARRDGILLPGPFLRSPKTVCFNMRESWKPYDPLKMNIIFE
jgi:hypothetical protein